MSESSSSSAAAVETPEIRLGPPPNFCSWGPRPYVLTGFLVNLFVQHFAVRDQVADPALRDEEFLWRADPRGIVIKSITDWDPDATMHRPAVLVARGEWQAMRIGIDERMMGGLVLDGFERYSGLWQGSHTLWCKAVEAAQAELLAAEVMYELRGFAPEIRTYLNLMRFAVAQLGRLHQLEEAIGGYAVPVTVAYACEDQWIIRRHAPKLKTILLSLMTP